MLAVVRESDRITGIENRITFDTSPRRVFKHLANPENIPLFVPGIHSARIREWVPDGVGTRVALRTDGDRHREAVVTEESERRFIAIQDDHGVVNEWELKRGPGGGTAAVNRIIGEFGAADAERLGAEARTKLHAFKDIVDAGPLHRNGSRGP